MEPGDIEDENEEVIIEAETAQATFTNLEPKTWAVPTPGRDLNELSEKLITSIEDADNYSEFLNELQDTVVVFFAVAMEVLKDRSATVLEQELLQLEYQDGTVADQISRQGRYNLLRHFEIIDEHLANKVRRTFEYRDSLFHEPDKRYRAIDLDNLKERIEDARESVNEMDDLVWKDW